jgi:hypothetical protein
MKPPFLKVALVGVLSLGMGTPSILAQDGYGPAPRGYYRPTTPSPAYPAYPDAGGYPSSPYRGGYQPGPSADYPSNPGSYYPSRDPYGNPPVPPQSPYGGGYPARPSAPNQVYQRGYSQPVAPDPGVYGDQPYGGYQPGPSPVVGLADQLVQQADTFLRGFAPTARAVPQGAQFLADASALRDAAARFRQATASGANPANEFGAVAALYQRLESRIYSVSKGRVGPNIANALQMGQTIEQIRGVLR